MTSLLRFSTLALIAGLLVAAALPSVGLAQGSTLVIVPKKSDPNQLISFSFQQADIDDVLRFLADASGKVVYKDPAVITSVTIRNQSRIPVSQAIVLIQNVLSLKGYALLETTEALVVTTAPEARTRRSMKVGMGKTLDEIPTGKEIITHIFSLTTVDAVQFRQELQPLFPAGGGILIANAETNSIVVVDEADNVRRVAEIILRVDRPITDQITIEVVYLKHADASAMSQYLTELFRQDEQRPPQQQQSGSNGQSPTNNQRGGFQQLKGRVRFAADQRANALVVYASPENQESVRKIVDQLDVDVSPRTVYHVVALKYADAVGLADQLNQLLDPNASSRRGFFGGFGGGSSGERGLQDYRVVPDVRTNSLILTVPVDTAEHLLKMVENLDQPSQVKDVVRVFQLKNAIASEVANSLRSLFQGTQAQGGFGFALFGGGNRAQIPANSPLDLLRQVTIVPNDQTNQLLISGPAQTFAVIEELISEDRGLDRKLPQVFIEVVIADITLDDETKFGIEWNAISGSNLFGTNFGLTSPTADPTGFRYSILSRNFQATLQALKSTDKLKIISTPHVMVTDNSPALISIGESIPYAGETTISNGIAQTSTAFQDVAITLNVTPHISPGNYIMMDVDQVVNSLIGFINIAPGQVAPRTTSRRAGTTVTVKNSQTVVLGGIISNDEARTIKKVPILGDLPLIGNLFRNTVKSKGRTELVVFLTPHIVRDETDADVIREYERERLLVDPLKAPFVRPLDLNYLKPENVFKPRIEGAPAVPAEAPPAENETPPGLLPVPAPERRPEPAR